MPQTRPAPIRTDATNPFANHTMRVRVPAIVREVQALNPTYTLVTQKALDALYDSLVNNDVIPMLDLPAPDYDDWAAIFAEHPGDTWQSSDWFFAEVYFYRLLMQVTRFFEVGRDPFAPKKAEEISGASLWKMLDLALETQSQPKEDRLAVLLQHALWGNRIDLSYAASAAHGGAWEADDLLVDDRHHVEDYLLGTPPGSIHIISDNTGTELAMDLALVDALLDGIAQSVVFHLKMHPTFVSDTTIPDMCSFLDLLVERPGEPGKLGARLTDAFAQKRIRFMPDFYWNSSRFLWQLPPRLTKTFQGASLVILKGDLNYRRLVGDAMWPADVPFASVADYFPAPLLALRTLKSDTVVGLPGGMAERLGEIDKTWRTNGRRGLIQFKGRG